MANETDDALAAAERLEAALERIARLATAGGGAGRPAMERGGEPATAELAAGLDGLIDRLRTALGGKAD